MNIAESSWVQKVAQIFICIFKKSCKITVETIKNYTIYWINICLLCVSEPSIGLWFLNFYNRLKKKQINKQKIEKITIWNKAILKRLS